VGHTITFGTSDNATKWWDNKHAAHLGYVPKHSSAEFAGNFPDSADYPAAGDAPTIYQGGPFVTAGPMYKNLRNNHMKSSRALRGTGCRGSHVPTVPAVAAEAPSAKRGAIGRHQSESRAVGDGARGRLAAGQSQQAPSGRLDAGGGYNGIMALANISGSSKYRDAMIAMGEKNNWKLGPNHYHADDHIVGQTYAELYLQTRDPKMIAPLRASFDDILANRRTGTLDFTVKGNQDRWSWCDALYMAPPAWLRLWAITGDQRYLDFAISEWWATSDYLYDKEEHLYFRDSNYFDKREANGKKVYWSRGNGWVMGGLVRVLQYLPENHPERPRFVQQYKDMAAKLLTLQQADGLWRASLLDPDTYPMKESSGSALYTYAFAWGVNQGLLDAKAFKPAVQKAWSALVANVQADGKLTHVQPIGLAPKVFDET
jgi:rhamnogalacturonyl hydrolase YesR